MRRKTKFKPTLPNFQNDLSYILSEGKKLRDLANDSPNTLPIHKLYLILIVLSNTLFLILFPTFLVSIPTKKGSAFALPLHENHYLALAVGNNVFLFLFPCCVVEEISERSIQVVGAGIQYPLLVLLFFAWNRVCFR